MTHVFQRYFDKHGHFPRVVVVSGVQRITIEFNPGYVRIATSSPYQAQVYITRTAAIQLIRKALPLFRVMRAHHHPDHDVPAAMTQAYQFEVSILQEKRALKKDHDSVAANEEHERQRRQRERFLRARERAARRHAAEEGAQE